MRTWLITSFACLAVALMIGTEAAHGQAVVLSQPDVPKNGIVGSDLTAVGTGFAFQTLLSDAQGPITGVCDLRFFLYDAVTAGTQQGPRLTFNEFAIQDGLVSLALDFASVFDGSDRWLESQVRCPSGSGVFTILAPRQSITPTPYAVFAQTAASAQSAAGDFIVPGVITSGWNPAGSDVAAAVTLENKATANQWTMTMRANEGDKLGFNFWDEANQTWRYGLRLDKQSNLSLDGGLSAQSVSANSVQSAGDLVSAAESDGVNAGALILENLTTGNHWDIPIRAEYGDSLDFHFWDDLDGTWHRPARLERNGALTLETSEPKNITLLQLNHPRTQALFHIDNDGHFELGIRDVVGQVSHWNVIDVDQKSRNVGIGGEGVGKDNLTIYGSSTITNGATGGVTLLNLDHLNTRWRFHIDQDGHAEIGFANTSDGNPVWNALDMDPTTGHVGMGTQATATEQLRVLGDFTATGTKAATVDTGEYGLRKFYAVEAADVRFSDEGLATLADGMARVDLDPIFVAAIEAPYIITLTPYGNASLYVDEIGTNFFTVRVREGAQNVQFAWRLSAPRLGYSHVRLEAVEDVPGLNDADEGGAP